MPATQAQAKFVRLTPVLKEALVADTRFQNLLSCINRTWQVIGPDSEAACAEMGEKPMKKSERLEVVLDANYISTNCGKDGVAAEDYLKDLEKIYGYKAVEKFLLEHAYI